jgi:hypothetical protein
MSDNNFSDNNKLLLKENGFEEDQIKFLYDNELRDVYFIIASLRINGEQDKPDTPAKMIERIQEFNKKYEEQFYKKKMDEILTKIDEEEKEDPNLPKPVILKFIDEDDMNNPVKIESEELMNDETGFFDARQGEEE